MLRLWNTYKCLKYLQDVTVKNNLEPCALNGSKVSSFSFYCWKAQALKKSVTGTRSSQNYTQVGSFTNLRIISHNQQRGIKRLCNVCTQAEMMKKSKAPSTRRAEIQRLYQCYALGQNTLPAGGLLRFIHKEQMEPTANEEMVESLIDRYEIDETGKWRRSGALCGALTVVWGQQMLSRNANLALTEMKA